MIKYKQTYCEYFNIGEQDRPVCEIPGCQNEINSIHHINGRGKKFHTIEYLIGLCMFHHNQIHFGKNNDLTKEYLTEIHSQNLCKSSK
jgi:hypothetical protein